MEFKISTNSFNANELIPKKYTCDGENISPELNWQNAPSNTKSFALICDDPDAPMGTWVHWVLFNIPPNISMIPENIPSSKNVLETAIHGINDFGQLGYGGPCPPSGTHRYFFKIYALDTILNLGKNARKSDVVGAMKGHILGEAQLIGKYKRQK